MIPNGATLYSFRNSYPSVIVREKANTARLAAYRSGALVAPSSATYTLVGPSGTAIVSAETCTISNSVAQYSIPSASLPATVGLGEGFQERWVFTFAGEPATVEVLRPACLVVAAIYPVVTDLDLTAQYFALGDYLAGSMTSYQTQIDEAWGQLMARMVRHGRLPYCVRTPDALRECHLHLTLAITFQGFGLGAEGEHWRVLAKQHREEYERSYQQLTLQLDNDQDRLVDNPNLRDPATVPTFLAPAYGRRNSIWRRV